MRCRAEYNGNSSGSFIDIYYIGDLGRSKDKKQYLATIHEDDLDHKMINDIMREGGIPEFDAFTNIIDIEDTT